MRRYENIPVIKKEGQRRYTTTLVYPIIQPKINDTYIITKEGDRLDNLSWEYYRDPTYWWVIARANGMGLGTLFPQVGVQLRIPDDIETITQEYNDLNKIEE